MVENPPTGICAFIDILGFANHVRTDANAALHLLGNYQAILESKSNQAVADEALMPYRQDSFKYFIPFSDSIFLYSEQPSNFVQQLSQFVHSCFTFTSNQYSNPKDAKLPHQVTVRAIELENGKPVVKEYTENWHPLLFRGGLGYGDATIVELNAVHNGQHNRTPIVFGKSVIDAVKLEQSGVKGPRLLCDKRLYEQLNERTKRIVHPAFDVKDYYDINWTAVDYLASVESIFEPEEAESANWFVDQLLLNEFYLEMLTPTVNLWKAYNHMEIGTHYFKFLKLIVKGVQHFFADSQFSEKIRSEVYSYLQRLGVGDKADDLIE